jgi:hypothetical protein
MLNGLAAHRMAEKLNGGVCIPGGPMLLAIGSWAEPPHPRNRSDVGQKGEFDIKIGDMPVHI